MKFNKQLLKSLPKVLLHEHLDGVLRPQTVIELARDANYTGLPTDDAGALSDWFFRGANQGSLAKYLEGFVHTIAAIIRVPQGLKPQIKGTRECRPEGLLHPGE